MAKPPKDDLESANEDEYDQETLEFLRAHRSSPEHREKEDRYFKKNPIMVTIWPNRSLIDDDGSEINQSKEE